LCTLLYFDVRFALLCVVIVCTFYYSAAVLFVVLLAVQINKKIVMNKNWVRKSKRGSVLVCIGSLMAVWKF